MRRWSATLFAALVIISLFALCAVSGGAATAQFADTPGDVMDKQEPEPTATRLGDEIIATRTPEPTATPGRIEQALTQQIARAGLLATRFLGLRVIDWANLAISLVYVLIGYLIGTWVIRWLLPRIIRRTAATFDDRLQEAIGPDLRWLLVIFSLNWATGRLAFISAALKTVLGDAYFVLGLALGVRPTAAMTSTHRGMRVVYHKEGVDPG